MPNIKTAIKRVRINETKKAQNIAFKSALRTAVKKFEVAAETNADNAKELLNDAVKQLDKAVSKGVMHKNAANRKKARLTKKISA